MKLNQTKINHQELECIALTKVDETTDQQILKLLEAIFPDKIVFKTLFDYQIGILTKNKKIKILAYYDYLYQSKRENRSKALIEMIIELFVKLDLKFDSSWLKAKNKIYTTN